MSDAAELLEIPQAKEICLLAGWRQWADAGSVSSGLPRYLVQQAHARLIGQINPDGFYLFQFPGTHDLIRPVIKYDEGFPVSLEAPENRFYYLENSERGLVIFLGDEPHMDVERYSRAFLDAAERLNVRRIVGLGGVYGEVPYNKERSVSCSYSLKEMKAGLQSLAVGFSNYHGGASIGSYICRRAGEREMEYISLYSVVPMYDFTNVSQIGNSVRIENDFTAWLGLMRRVNYLFKIFIDLADLEKKSQRLVRTIDAKMRELERQAPQLNLSEYLARLNEEFTEMPFIPLDDIWEEKLRGILDRFDSDEDAGSGGRLDDER